MTLAKRLLNNPGLTALCVPEELAEIQVVQRELVQGVVKLRRTFNQATLNGASVRFWRVVGPASHPNFNSDLSIAGLRDWGII